MKEKNPPKIEFKKGIFKVGKEILISDGKGNYVVLENKEDKG